MFGIDAQRKARRWAEELQEAPRRALMQTYYDALLEALNRCAAAGSADGLALGEAIATVLSQVIQDLRPVDRRRLLQYVGTRCEAMVQGRILAAAERITGPEIPAGATEH